MKILFQADELFPVYFAGIWDEEEVMGSFDYLVDITEEEWGKVQEMQKLREEADTFLDDIVKRGERQVYG